MLIITFISMLIAVKCFYFMWVFVSNEFKDTKRFYSDEDSQNYFNTSRDVMAIELFKYAKTLPKSPKKTKILALVLIYFLSLVIMITSVLIHFTTTK